MIHVLRRNGAKAARIAERDRGALVVAIGPLDDADRHASTGVASIGIRVASRKLASKLEQAMAHALEELAALPLPAPRTVRVVSRASLDRLGAGVEGAFAIVPVTAKNLRRVGDLVDELRRGRARGVQLVWDGEHPPRELAEAKVFAILERARATPSEPPVILSRENELVASLRIVAQKEAVSAR